MDWKRIRAPVPACITTVLVLAFGVTPAWADEHSCDPERLPPAGVTRWEGREVVRYSGSQPIRGDQTNDFIIGTAGRDTIVAGYGRDIVCAGSEEDVIYGGGSSDDLHGQGGRDRIFGELLDDELWGEDGPDVLIGGHGTDTLQGGLGNDWMRGGTNVDHFIGGENERDHDVASFADTTESGGKVEGWSGVWVNMTATEKEEGADRIPPYTAIGNGRDEIREVESVIGSAFDDKIVANTELVITLYGGMGSDSCSGGCAEPATSLSAPFAYVDRPNPISGVEPSPPDPVLIAVGGSAAESFALSNTGTRFNVTATAGGSPETLNSDASCSRPTRGTVTCTFGATPVVGGQVWFGGDGADAMDDRTEAPNGVTTDLDGGNDSDTIDGSAGSETIFSGNSGNDVLHGRAGGDALLALGVGGDQVYGDEGNDQIATSNPCEGHVFRGGADQDVVGFARTTTGVNATLGNPAGNPANVSGSWYGPAFKRTADDTNACPDESPNSRVGADNEILEGTDVADILNGNQNANTFWARRGSDIVHAANGDDILEGHDGTDRLEGEGGDDTIRGQADPDTVLGGPGADTIFGGPGGDRLHGDEGNDEIDGEGESDSIWGEDGADRLTGGTGFDDLYGGRDNDSLFGDSDGDELFGGTEDDLVNGGDGADELFGQAGNDRLRARDGVRDDAVACGDGTDEPAEADEFDPVSSC